MISDLEEYVENKEVLKLYKRLNTSLFVVSRQQFSLVKFLLSCHLFNCEYPVCSVHLRVSLM